MSKTMKIILGCLVGLALLQLIPVNRVNPPIDAAKEFTSIVDVPTEVEKVMRTSCYDCHSFETIYPDYAYVAPLSWSVRRNIKEGRSYANFSVWSDYSKEAKETIIKSVIEQVEQREMPKKAYISFHPEAQLDSKERALIIDFFTTLKVD